MESIARASRMRLAALVGTIVILAVGGMAGWIVLQDRAYESQLDRAWASHGLDQASASELGNERIRAQRAIRDSGIAPAARSARLQRLSLAGIRDDIRRDATSLEAVDPPRRWAGYHELAVAQRSALVDRLSSEIAVAAHVATVLGDQPTAAEVTALASDPDVQRLVAIADERAASADAARARLDAAIPPFTWMPSTPDSIGAPVFERQRFRLPTA